MLPVRSGNRRKWAVSRSAVSSGSPEPSRSAMSSRFTVADGNATVTAPRITGSCPESARICEVTARRADSAGTKNGAATMAQKPRAMTVAPANPNRFRMGEVKTGSGAWRQPDYTGRRMPGKRVQRLFDGFKAGLDFSLSRRRQIDKVVLAGLRRMNLNELPLWTPRPERVADSQMMTFMGKVNARHGLTLAGFRALHAWTVANPDLFWDAIWDYCDVIGEKGSRLLVDGDKMPGARFFPDARLNFAENLIRDRDGEALIFRGEDKVSSRMSMAQLRALVSRLQQALKASGVGVGDRVAAMLPNTPETVAAMLAVTSIGAIWSSCSPDFGDAGVLDRFGQIEPKVFITWTATVTTARRCGFGKAQAR